MRFLFLFFAIFTSRSLMAQTPCFTTQSLPPTSLTIAGLPTNGPRWVSSGDLNNDGRADLVVSNSNQTLSILLGNGTGGFGAPTTSISLGNTSDATILADLDGNGRLDILSVDYGTTQAFRILIGDGLGGFSQGPSPNSPATTLSMALGDVTGDGRADIISANNTGQGISIFAGQPFAVFSAPTTINFTVALPQITLGRIDNNASLDMLISDPLNDNVVRCLNNGSGGFAFDFFSVGDNPTNPVLADVNDDNVNDLLVANRSGANLTVRLNNGTGGFGARIEYEVNNNPDFLTMADVDGDGKLDAVLTAGGSVIIKLGNGTGGFGESVFYATAIGGSDPAMVITPDLTGDGRPDLVTPNGNGVGLGVLLNNSYGGFLTYSVGTQPLGIAIGDLNSDGLADIATVTQSALNNVLVLFAKPDGSYRLPSVISISATLTDIGILDVNGDGVNDLLLTKRNGTATNGELLTLLGVGNGTFGAATSQPTGRNPVRLTITDVNRDNRLDVMVLNASNSSTSVFLNTGSGLATATTQASGNGDTDIVATDINGDGGVDLLTINQAGGTLYELYGNGDGTFGGTVTRALGTAPSRIAAGDLNNDGRIDLVVSLPNSGEVRVLQNTGNVGNSPSGAVILTGTNIAVGSTPDAVAIADMNGDGRSDIVITQRAANAVRILYNTGAMSFTTSTTIATGQFPLELAVSQLASDNRPDIVVGNATDRTLSIINNCTVFPAVAIQPFTSLTVAAGQPFSLTAVASLFTPTSYAWSSRPTAIAGFGSTGATVTGTAPGVMAPTAYTITVTASNSLVSVKGTKIITVVPVFLQTVKDGTWRDPTVWSGGYVPLGYEVVRIGHEISVNFIPPVNQVPTYTLKVIYTAGGKIRFNGGGRLYFGPDE